MDSGRPARGGCASPRCGVGFLVQLTDGSGRDLAAPQCLGDVLHTAHGDTRQVHLNERLLHAALPAAIPLDDGCLKGHTLKSGHMERDVVAGGRGEVPVIMAAAIALTGLATLIAGRLCRDSASFSNSSFRFSSTLPRTNFLMVLCQDLVQVKMRNFSQIQPASSSALVCALLYTCSNSSGDIKSQ